ncbi:hypothetical protein KFK09_003262 [Dendrobium nobile]|uniref:Uncharacterized protein n=1 Tax=Dendrobium nobile TaxID=94219 RepID=A0A8T3C3M1_DENNO|nr:hypothetical protein KFK09_003262 [Dendrobium nobile]
MKGLICNRLQILVDSFKLGQAPWFFPLFRGFPRKNSGVSYECYTLSLICLCAGSSYNAKTLN